MELKEIKKKWLEELRHGQHNQTQGTLCRKLVNGELGYCCLGVLHKHVLGNNIRAVGLDSNFEGAKSHYINLDKYLPSDIKNSGIDMNDSGYSFFSIADMIEKEWKVE